MRALVPTVFVVSAAAVAAACGGDDNNVDPNSIINGADAGGSSSGASSGGSSGASSSGGSSGTSSSGGSSGSSGDGGVEAGPPPLLASTLAAGGSSACAIDAAGTLKCWGALKAASQVVGAGSTFNEVDVGGFQTCAIKSDKTLWCWTSSTFTPASKDTGAFKKVGVGDQHSCAINELGKLFCWGQNFYGQLGTGDNTTQANLTPVAPNKSWGVVTAGALHTCAIDDASGLWCWGYNGSGEVGDGGGSSVDGGISQQQSPVAIMAGTTWLDVSAGSNATCGIASDRKLRCWGTQLGENNKTPTAIDTAADWSMVRISSTHGCALKTGGALYCWGQNANGQVGNGLLAPTVNNLAQVGSDTDWAAVDVGSSFSCGRKKSGAILCWGTNGNGELGIGTATHLAPTKIGGAADWAFVNAGADATCAVKKTGQLLCWGNTQYLAGPDPKRQLPYQIGSATAWSTVSVGYSHACARKIDDSVHCWGQNYNGALGVPGSVSQLASPTAVGLNASTVSAGSDHTCAIEAGTSYLWCWGRGYWDQLFSPGDSLVPRKALNDNTFIKVAASANDTCAIRTNGDVYCAGFGFTANPGELIMSNATDIAIQPGSDTYRAVSAGKIQTWRWIGSVTDDGTELAWKQLTSGGSHRCALRTNNTLACAGSNSAGQIGDGTTTTKSVYTSIGAAADWQQVTAGSSHTCGLRNDGELYCWGGNASGQIGDGTAWSTTPVPVQ